MMETVVKMLFNPSSGYLMITAACAKVEGVMPRDKKLVDVLLGRQTVLMITTVWPYHLTGLPIPLLPRPIFNTFENRLKAPLELTQRTLVGEYKLAKYVTREIKCLMWVWEVGNLMLFRVELRFLKF
ncbi:hypothetical protein TNCV_1298521 [Trichonephila clavipes]|nr:hypothetical protein TNCV_1298521 [Trichonephila clavipes]